MVDGLIVGGAMFWADVIAMCWYCWYWGISGNCPAVIAGDVIAGDEDAEVTSGPVDVGEEAFGRASVGCGGGGWSTG